MQTPGDFFAAGECALHVPLIEVDSVGPIALPVLPAQAAQLIAVAERAPYGRGADTLVDTAGEIAYAANATLADAGLPPHSTEQITLRIGGGALR